MIRVLFLTAAAALAGRAASPRAPVPVALPNDNRVAAGTLTPKEPGRLRLEVRAAGLNGRLFNRVPIRVE
jgi:hypothetical protein